MSLYFKYLNFPSLPESIHSEVYNSYLENLNYFEFKKFKPYKVHQANNKLTEEVRSIIPNATDVNVQLIQYGLPVHIDVGRTEAINYIISTGGDNVCTCFYQNRSLVEQYIIEPFRWHWINVSIPHTVINLKKDSTRISITISY
jgi:hypothetical protein